MKNSEIREKLNKYIPGGAHTYSKGDDQWPANAPACIARGKGARVWDAEGNEFVDWSMGLTSACLGHGHEEINAAAIEAMANGHNFQRPSVIEALAAEKFINFMKDRGEMIKFAKNGSTVTTAAIKLSRAFTRRPIAGICSDSAFFSYDDWFIGSTHCPDGVPNAVRELTKKFHYNDIDSVKTLFAENPGKVACLILEPTRGTPPKDGFLEKIAEECRKNGAVLIFDEMVSGFKWHARGASTYYGVGADLYTWGKGMSNGHSVCALTGRAEIMKLGGLNHDKPRVFLTSTTHGAEIPQLAASIKTLEIFERDPEIIPRNWKRGQALRNSLTNLVQKHGMEEFVGFAGDDCLYSFVVKNSRDHKSNVARTYMLQELAAKGMLFQGLFYMTPAHTDRDIDQTLEAWDKSLPKFKEFLTKGDRSWLIGEPTKPVFRIFNSCECLSTEDCKKCIARLSSL